MSRKKQSRAASFFDGFNQGYETVGKVLSDKEISDIAKADQVDNSSFTPEQGKQLEDAAAGGANITYDQDKRAYVINQPDGAAQDVSMAKRGVSFLGKDYEKPLSDSEKDVARTQAMAGVYSKFGDPAKAMDMKAKAQSLELSGIQLDSAKRAGEYDKGWGEMWKNTPLAKAAAEQRDPTMGEQMGTVASMMEYKAKHGKLNPEELMSYTEKLNGLKNENYTSAMRVLNAGGSPEAIAAEFNKTGKAQVDPSQMAIRPVTVKVNGKDVQTYELTYMQDGKAHVINGFRELDGLGKADNFFQRQLQANADTRGDKQLSISGGQLALAQKAENRAQSVFDSGATGRKNTEEVAKLQAVLAGTKDTAKRAEITQQINDLSGAAGDSNAPAEVKLANAALKAGLHTDMKSALEWATKSKDLSPDKMRFEIYKTALTQSMGDATKAKEITDKAMTQFGTSAKPAGREVGAEQVIQAGPNKGKTAVWDGQGWKLKG